MWLTSSILGEGVCESEVGESSRKDGDLALEERAARRRARLSGDSGSRGL